MAIKENEQAAAAARPPGVVSFHRPGRTFPDPPPRDRIVIAAPPAVPQPPAGGFLHVLFPLVGSLGMIGFALVYRNALFFAIAGGIALLMLVASVALRVQQKRSYRRTRATNVARYRDYLDKKRAELEAAGARRRAALEHVHPGIDGLWSIVNARSQLWERRRSDPDFMTLRLGRGRVELSAPVAFDLGEDPLVEHEPELLAEATSLVDELGHLSMAPLTAPLRDAGTVALVGSPKEARALARALLAEVAVAHAPDDVRIVASIPPETVAEWEWMKWLPHARLSAETRADDPVAVALAVDADDFEILLSQVVRPRLEHLERVRNEPGARPPSFQHVVVLVDECTRTSVTGVDLFEEMLRRAPEIGVLALVLVEGPERVPSTAGARIDLSEGGWATLTWAGPEGERVSEIRAETAGTEICEAIARQIAPLRLRIREDAVRRVESESLLDLLHAGAGADVGDDWVALPPDRVLRTPIGLAADGSEAFLDLKESAEGGMGPHGLVVGATGSGKSELLRTLITGLALSHSPEDLAFVLVDYKGGATFAELARLPHAAGMITNIERDLTLVDRMHEALFGELERRQRLLQGAGGFDRARDYQEHRARHPEKEMPPLPSLVVIVDEFGELLTRRPDFLDLFVSIGRTGRSLGVHLLLSTQRLDEGRIRGLEGHLRYRICLRTFSAEESMLALGTRDAFDMPPFPGLGYLRVDQTLQHFKAALATRPYREHRGLDAAPARVVRDFDVVRSGEGLEVVVGEAPRTEPSRRRTTPLRTEMQVVVERLSGRGADVPVRQVWLPPLRPALTLDSLSDSLDKTTGPGEPAWLEVPIGVVDRPREQDQQPYALSFGGRGGHLAVVGAPRSGKSTVLQTLIASLALAHDPADVQVYAIDLGGGSMHALADLPHVGAVYGRSDREGVFRLVRELRSLVAERARVFRSAGLSGVDAYHAARREGRVEDDGYGEVFLVVDNWALLVQEFEDLQYAVADLVAGGLHYGVHVVITSNRWHDVRLNVRDNVGGRLELRLNDPIESEIDRHSAKALPGDVPGRALNAAGEHVQVALPRVDGGADIAGLGLALERLVQQVSYRWATSPAAPAIRMLPERLAPDDVGAADGVAIGVEEFRLEPVVVAPDDPQPHLLVLGEAGCGKTNLLRALLRGLGSRYGEDEVRVAVVDYRRRLVSDARSLPHVKAIAVNAAMTTDLVMKLASDLTNRLPAGDAALDAAPWTGPHVYLLVDDYDLVSGSGGNPLGPLVDLVAQGRDIGFHVVVARRVGGTVRSSYEPFFQGLVELGTPGLIMSGDPGEGPLLGGVKAQPLPPGRGTLVAQGRTALVQTILVPDDERT